MTAHLPQSALDAPFAATRRGLAYGLAVLALGLIALLVALHYFLARRMSQPTIELAITNAKRPPITRIPSFISSPLLVRRRRCHRWHRWE